MNSIWRTMSMAFTGATALIVAAGSAAAQRSTWSVVNLHPAGTSSSQAWAIHDGIQAGEANVGGRRASVWTGTAESWQNLNPPFATFSYILSTRGGQHVGAALVDGFSQASLWTGNSATDWVSLHPPHPDANFSVGMGGGTGQQVGRVGFDPCCPRAVHAFLWTGSAASGVNLHPGGTVSETWGLDSDGTQQVGSASIGGTGRSSLWTGSAASWIDLTPPTALASRVERTHDGWQVGMVVETDFVHAALWNSTPESWVNLNPAGTNDSWAFGIFEDDQVGYANLGGQRRAGLWSGSAASFVNLHDFLPAGYTSSEARGVWSDGSTTYVVGFARNSTTNQNEAIMWVREDDCYANCDGSTTEPILNVEDFTCFINEFATASTLPPAQQLTHYANCDGSTTEPILNVEDFICFIDAFAAGCP
jgi:hypothetical protein